MIWLLAILMLLFSGTAHAQVHTFEADDSTWNSFNQCFNQLQPCNTVSHAPPGGTFGPINTASPQTGAYNAHGQAFNNLAAASVNGDAVAFGQSGVILNGLALSGAQLTGLGPATGVNQAIAYGQTGALLNGLNLNSTQLIGLAAATGNNQAIAQGQSGASLNGLSLNGNALTAVTFAVLTPAATFPALPTIGQVATVNTATNCISGSAITLAGSSICTGLWTGSQWQPVGGTASSSSAINLAPSQTGTYHANVQGFDQLANMTADTSSAHTLTKFSVNGRLSIGAYGAVGDNSTLASTSIQAAINAACANATAFANATTPGVYLPNGNYKLDKPLVLTCATSNTFDLEADDRATANLVPAFTGPAIVVAAGNLISSLNSGTITASPLIGASGNSLFWTATTPWWLDIQEDMGSVTPTMLNGSAALTVHGFFSTPSTAAGETIASSSGAVDYWRGSCNAFNANIMGGVAICTGAYGVWIDGTDHKLHGYVTTSTTGVVYVVSSGTVTASTTLEYDLEYDGAHAQIALGGTWGPAVAATGTIVRRPDEVATIGTLIGYWPHVNPLASFNGSIFDPEIANVARQTLGTNYTQHSAVYTFDTHTMYGSLFGSQINMPTTSSPVLFGADYFNGASTTATWASVHNYGLGCCGGHYDIGRLGIVGGSIGIDVAAADVTLNQVTVQNQSYMQVNLSPNASFNSGGSEIRGYPLSQAMGQLVAEGGIQTVTGLYTLACGQLCDYINNGNIRDAYIAGQSNTNWGIVCSQGCSLSNINDDNENGGTCPGVTMEKSPTVGYTAFVIDDNSQLSGCSSNVTPIAIEGDNNPSPPFSFTGDQFVWQTNSPPAALIHTVGGVGSVPPSITLSGNQYPNGLSPNIPYADGPVSLHVMSSSHWIEQAKTDWPLPQAVINNATFLCPSCDPPTNPPTPATHAGLMTGCQVHGVNNQWLCEPY